MNQRSRGSALSGCLIVAGIGVAVLVVLALLGVGRYNSLVSGQERVEGAFSEIDNQYQRRAELIPNLVATVEGAADFERSTLEAVIEARAAVGRVQLPANVLEDPAALEAYLQAQQTLGAAIGRLFAVAEQYPQLRATENFLTLQSQIEGTENRIAVARRDYIDAVRDYNTATRRFPGNLIAGLFGFERIPQPTIDAEQREAPKVDFGEGR